MSILSGNTYALLTILGTFSAIFWVLNRKKRYDLSTRQCGVFSLFAIAIMFLGAKMLYVLQNWETVFTIGLSFGGFSLFGAVFLFPILIPLVGRLVKLQPGQAADICGPCAASMLGFMRIGCYFNGCCGGYQVQLGAHIFCWPTQIVESVGAFAILGWLLQLEKEEKDEGMLYPLFMIAYGGLRFVVEFFRDTPKPWLHLGHGQWFAIIAILVGVLWKKLLEVKKYECEKK